MHPPGAFFEVTDRELDSRVVTVKPVGGDNTDVEAGDKRVATPVRPELCLSRVDEAAAAHHEAELASRRTASGDIDRFRNAGFAVRGVVDRRPAARGDVSISL
jgi:hypothetical protein